MCSLDYPPWPFHNAFYNSVAKSIDEALKSNASNPFVSRLRLALQLSIRIFPLWKIYLDIASMCIPQVSFLWRDLLLYIRECFTWCQCGSLPDRRIYGTFENSKDKTMIHINMFLLTYKILRHIEFSFFLSKSIKNINCACWNVSSL